MKWQIATNGQAIKRFIHCHVRMFKLSGKTYFSNARDHSCPSLYSLCETNMSDSHYCPQEFPLQYVPLAFLLLMKFQLINWVQTLHLTSSTLKGDLVRWEASSRNDHWTHTRTHTKSYIMQIFRMWQSLSSLHRKSISSKFYWKCHHWGRL